MEYIDIYNENNEPMNMKMEREEAHTRGMWHREVLVVVVNEKNEVLLQKRSYKRRYLPGKWALCAGHVQSGETEKQSAIRELVEELDMKIYQKDLVFLETYKKNGHANRKISYVYLARTNMKLNEYTIQEDELTDLKYVYIDELIKITKEDDKTLAFGGDKYHIDLFEKVKNYII